MQDEERSLAQLLEMRAHSGTSVDQCGERMCSERLAGETPQSIMASPDPDCGLGLPMRCEGNLSESFLEEQELAGSFPTLIFPMVRFEFPSVQGGGAASEDDQCWEVHTDDGFDDRRRSPCLQLSPPNLSRRNTLRLLPPETTTLVVRNIPARYTKERLLEEWIPDGSFDLLHLPYNSHQQRSLGYAFINFVTHEDALNFQAKVHGSYPRQAAGKHFDVSAAEVQGFHATLAHVNSRRRQRSCCMETAPAIFQGEARLSPVEVMERLGLQHMNVLSLQSRSRGKVRGQADARSRARPFVN